MRAGVTASRARSADSAWQRWADFCALHHLDPTLQDIRDPVPILQVYAYRYRTGSLAPSQRPVRSRTVEDSLRHVGQTLAALGSPDPRLNAAGRIDFRLQRQLSCYSRQDPPPNRVKPIPVPLLMYSLTAALASAHFSLHAAANMMTLAFFFLLRPGEYTGAASDSTPFRFQDVTLLSGNTKLPIFTAPLTVLDTATFVTLEFTTQKNGVRGEVIGLARSGNPTFCPVLTMIRQIKHLRLHHAPPATPLATYYHNDRPQRVTSAEITNLLRSATRLTSHLYGFNSRNISARSLRASGAMALLCAHIDTDIIRLIGRWRSDEMLRYLHVQAKPVMRNFSSRMLSGGSYHLLPNTSVPMF